MMMTNLRDRQLKEVKVIVAFYASGRLGSEYRSGAEFISFAAAVGFDIAVIADLLQNDNPLVLMGANQGIEIFAIHSPVRKQSLLYRFSDVVPQFLWHFRVARWLKARYGKIGVLWIQNGALPWLPMRPYSRIARKIIWGPVGGGQGPPARLIRNLDIIARLRERARNLLETIGVNRKYALMQQADNVQIVPIARTKGACKSLETIFPNRHIPIIPEILRPIKGCAFNRVPTKTPKFVWVGQNVPRKNRAL
jgi:hypothetical protein